MQYSPVLEVIRAYTTSEIFWIALSIFILAMGRGGFPAAPVAVTLLVLIFPAQAESAKTAVAFMLPLLIFMDIFGFFVYRKHILWKKLLPLVPGTLLGVIVASILFVSKSHSIVYIPDKWFKFTIGVIGLLFVVYQAAKKWLVTRLEKTQEKPGAAASGVLGFLAGIFSTVANSGMPPVQMYFLTQKLKKMNMAATIIAFFFCLNVVKLLPFGLMGRIEVKNLLLGVWMIPAIPLGVAAGYFLVHIMKQKHYIGLIYAALTVTSALLIITTFI